MDRIETTYGKFTAYVNPIEERLQKFYHISFVDNHNKVYVAVLTESTNGWSFVNPEDLPGWIVELHSQFELLIARHLLRHHNPAIAEAV
jgi:hypothetical protein